MLTRLRLRLQESPAGDDLLRELLLGAEALILACTGQPALPEALQEAQLRLAVIAYNRLGMEGESYRHEGGLSLRVDEMPESLLAQLRPYRLLRVPGR